MKNFKLFVLLLLTSIGFYACDEIEDAIPNQPVVQFHFQLVNTNSNQCHTINSITYIVDEEGVQVSYNVVNNDSKEFNVSVRRGELIGFTAFDTNDPSNTLLAAANIPSDNYSDTEVNNIRVYFTQCPSTDKILWISY
jgi:hypothetical protein